MNQASSNGKLGLAFAGGGFRAALFHTGVLYRLAELDLLRHVQMLSTVSGGSIVGAVYVLRLKKWLEEKSARLEQADYKTIVQETEEILCAGIEKNLRTRLLLNPLRLLRIMLGPESMGRSMARLYERHIFHEAVMRPPGAPARKEAWLVRLAERRHVRDALQLSNLLIKPKGAVLDQGIDAYNAQQQATHGSVITSIVINSTSLNSGGRFFFTGVELGDWYLGSFRYDELKDLQPRKTQPQRAQHEKVLKDYEGALKLALNDGFPGELPTCSYGLLRRLRLPVWYLREGYARRPQVTGGQTRAQHWRKLQSALREIDRNVAASVADLDWEHQTARFLLDYINELYLLRTAERMSGKFDRDWKDLTISDAVGASACFPPVFPPFILLGIYDDRYVRRLGLTDGGAYDNSGVTALLDERCTSVIASDTGGLFQQMRSAPAGHPGLVTRLPNILMNALGGFQRLVLRERKRDSAEFAKILEDLPNTQDCDAARNHLTDACSEHDMAELAYFHITSPAPPLRRKLRHIPPIETGLDKMVIASLRTDLDEFGEIERHALINHGYDMADRFARGFLVSHDDEWQDAHPRLPKDLTRGPRAGKVLQAGSARFFRALKVGAPVSIAVAALAAVAVIAAGFARLSIANVWTALMQLAQTVKAVPLLGPVLFSGWNLLRYLSHSFWLFVAAGVLLLMGVLLMRVRPARAEAEPAGSERPHTWWKQISSRLGWLLFLFGALPVVIAVITSFVAGISWLVFHLPWRARARIRPEERVPAREAATLQAAGK